MKKIILSVLMIFSAVLVTYNIRAEEPEVETGNLVVHYQNLTGNYDLIGLNSWGHENSGLPGGIQNPLALTDLTETDDFGIYWELNGLPISEEGSIGFQVVGFSAVDAGAPNWDTEKFANHEIQNDILVAGKTVHVYMLQGSNTRTNDEGLDEPVPYLYTDPTYHNLVVHYYDQSNAYDDNLGLHNWGWKNVDNAGWGSPSKVFKTVGFDLAGTPILGTILHFESYEDDAGLIVYAGGDDTKKTDDIKLLEIFDEPIGRDGAAEVIQIYNAGDGNTSNENVILNNGAKFIEEAYAFGFVGMSVADNGERVGTFAPTANQVIVQLNTSIKVMDYENEEEELTVAEKVTLLKQWFSVKDQDGVEMVISDVNFNTGAASVSSFVLILEGKINNAKDYTVSIDLGLEGDANRAASIELDIDKQGPTFIFLYPSDFDTKEDYEDRVILVEWNKPFDYNLFPLFVVNDDRDGDVTDAFYVPAGEFSKIDTNRVGDYVILLRVEDSWGNVTDEKFIFRVTKNK